MLEIALDEENDCVFVSLESAATIMTQDDAVTLVDEFVSVVRGALAIQ